MLSYIIESPAGCDAEKSDACAQRDSRVVKLATPEAFVCPPTDLGSNAATTRFTLLNYKNTEEVFKRLWGCNAH